jgi:hypothetical protein
MAQTEDGNNQESSSEAMNSWAAIYLWGLASGNTTYRDLGICGYVTEQSAVEEYYFNTNGLYSTPYSHTTVGILWGGKADYGTWFGNEQEYIHGIQFIPMNPAMLYLGYNPAFAAGNYANMLIGDNDPEQQWKDTLWNYQALFNPVTALSRYSDSAVFDSGNSKTFSYYWLNNLNILGKVDTTVYADSTAYGVFDKNGQKTYICANTSGPEKTIHFYRFSDNGLQGSLAVPAYSIVSSSDFVTMHSEDLLPKISDLEAGTTTLHGAFLQWKCSGEGIFTIDRSSDAIHDYPYCRLSGYFLSGCRPASCFNVLLSCHMPYGQ